MRVLFFLLFAGSAHLLSARWLLSVSAWARARRRKVWIVAGALAALGGTLRLIAYGVETSFIRFLMATTMIETTFLFFGFFFVGIIKLLSRSVTAVQLRVSPPKDEETKKQILGRREAVERIGGAVAFAGTGLALGWGAVRGRHAFELREVVIRIPSWPKKLDGYVIAQVSDVHVGTFVGDRELDEGFELVHRAKPDLVVATGDLVDFVPGEVVHLVKRLLAVPARDGAFAILGNHDHYGGAAEVADLCRQGGLRLLNNEAVVLQGAFTLLGVDDMQGRVRPAPGFAGPDLGRALTGVNPERPRILLAHQPRFVAESAGRVDLQISGHTHGGQINPGFRPADLIMEYVHGRYERDGTTLYVNRGFGVAGPPSRIGAPPEITKFVIVSS